MSRIVLEKENQLVNEISESCASFPWGDRDFYAQYLAQTYFYVTYSCPMLKAAAELCGPEDQDFKERCEAHYNEEHGHEVLAEQDLKRLGFSLKEFEELPETKELWMPQFEFIKKDPLNLLGYIMALEVFAMKFCPPVMEELNEFYGAKCSNFIRVHAEEDPDHVIKALKSMEGLDEERLDSINEIYIYTLNSFKKMLVTCLEKKHHRRDQRSAGLYEVA